MNFLFAFLVGGIICMIAQLLMDGLKLLPIHMVVLFVIIGSLLEMFNLYDLLINLSSAGALIPISSFGHSLTHAAVDVALNKGYLGIFSGMFDLTSTGISAAILFAFFIALICKPRG